MLKRLLLILGRLLFVCFFIIWAVIGILSAIVISIFYYVTLIPITWIIVGNVDCLPDFNIDKWVNKPLEFIANLLHI